MPDPASTSVIDQFVDHAKTLYTLPGVAVKVLDICKQPEVDARLLKDCIENDPALTAKILKVVNSSLFGLQQQVSDLNQAVTLLGITPLKVLVLGFSLPTGLFQDIDPSVLSRFWRTTIVRSVTCRVLGTSYWQCSGDEAFIVGLLRGVGQLVLVQELQDSYLRFLENAFEGGSSIEEAETEALGFDHAVLSGRMLRNWGLPESIVRGVSMPHDVERLRQGTDDASQFAQIVHVATHVSRFFDSLDSSNLEYAFQVAASYRAITIDEFKESIDKARSQFEKTAELFSIQIALDDDYDRVMLDAYEQLSQITSDPNALMPALPLPAGERAPSVEASLNEAVGGFQQSVASLATEPTVERSKSKQGSNRKYVDTEVYESPEANPKLLRKRLTMSVNSCRTLRRPVSLLLVEVDNAEDLLFRLSPHVFDHLIRSILQAISGLNDFAGETFRDDDSRIAMALEDCERSEALELGRRITNGVPIWAERRELVEGEPLILSGGVATLTLPPRNYPIEQMIEAAERCLFAAQSAGGGVTKSIDL